MVILGRTKFNVDRLEADRKEGMSALSYLNITVLLAHNMLISLTVDRQMHPEGIHCGTASSSIGQPIFNNPVYGDRRIWVRIKAST